MKIFVKPHLEDLYNTFVCVYFWDSVLATSSSPATLWSPLPRSCIPPYHSPPRRPWTPSTSLSPPYPDTNHNITKLYWLLVNTCLSAQPSPVKVHCIVASSPSAWDGKMREKVVVRVELCFSSSGEKGGWTGWELGATRQCRGWNWLLRSLWRSATNWWQAGLRKWRVLHFSSVSSQKVTRRSAGGIILVWLSNLGCSDRGRYIWSVIKYNSIP